MIEQYLNTGAGTSVNEGTIKIMGNHEVTIGVGDQWVQHCTLKELTKIAKSGMERLEKQR